VGKISPKRSVQKPDETGHEPGQSGKRGLASPGFASEEANPGVPGFGAIALKALQCTRPRYNRRIGKIY